MNSNSVKLAQPDVALENAGKIMLVIMWCLTIYIYPRLPDLIPTHFNTLGQADANSRKLLLLVLLVAATGLYIFLTGLSRNRVVGEILQKIVFQTGHDHNAIATRMLRVLKLELLLVCSLALLFVYLLTFGLFEEIEFWLLPVCFGVLLLPSIITISQTVKREREIFS